MVFVIKLLNKKLLCQVFENNAFINMDSTTGFNKTNIYYINNTDISVP